MKNIYQRQIKEKERKNSENSHEIPQKVRIQTEEGKRRALLKKLKQEKK